MVLRSDGQGRLQVRRGCRCDVGCSGLKGEAVPIRRPAAGTTANSRCVTIIIYVLKMNKRCTEPSPDLPTSQPS